jgi:hypothetical protein
VIPLVALLLACNYPKPAETEDDAVGGASIPESTHAVRGPDGTDGWLQITCGESSECYQRASITCPNGYTVFDRDKSTSYSISGSASSATRATRSGRDVVANSHTEYSGNAIPIDHGQLLVKCASTEANDQKLLDQLRAYCDDGNEEACKAHDFAVRKRGCCTWHQGARKCEEGRVVCFDGAIAERCSC